MIQNIIEQSPKPKYILALDDSKPTLEEIVMVKMEIHYTGSECFYWSHWSETQDKENVTQMTDEMIDLSLRLFTRR